MVPLAETGKKEEILVWGKGNGYLGHLNVVFVGFWKEHPIIARQTAGDINRSLTGQDHG